MKRARTTWAPDALSRRSGREHREEPTAGVELSNLSMSRRSKLALAGVLWLWFSCAALVGAQTAEHSLDSSERRPDLQAPPFTVRSNLVLVPVLVKTKTGEPVFSLTADDFILTDNSVPQ